MFRNYHYHHPFIIVVLLVVAVVFIIIIITVTTINLCLSVYPPIGLSATQTHIPSASINDLHEHTHSFQIKTKARIEFPDPSSAVKRIRADLQPRAPAFPFVSWGSSGR